MRGVANFHARALTQYKAVCSIYELRVLHFILFLHALKLAIFVNSPKFAKFSTRDIKIRQGFLFVKSFKKFYVKYTNLVSKYNVCLKGHISDGVCGLYVGLPSMYKHVTV